MRFGFALCLLPCAFLGAQAPATPPQPTFRAGVTLVTTDVIARDDRGQFVSDLTKDSFTVLEDGQPQTIQSFILVQGGRTFNLLAPPSATAAPEGIILPQARPRTSDTGGRVFLILVDDLHFEPELTPHVRKLIQTITDTLLHEGDLAAVVSTGPSFIEVGLTYDRKLVAEAANKVRGSGYLPSEIFKLMENSQGPGDVRNKAQMAFHTAYNILADLEKVPNRRKAVIYISTGYDFDPFAEGRNSRDRVMGGRFSDPMRLLIDEDNPYFSMGRVTADIDLYRLTRELTLSANRANASIYTIDPRGLAGTLDAGQYVDQSEWRTYIQKTTSTLKYLSEETGGFAIVDTNDFAAALKRVDAETSDYYVLGFYSSNPDPARRTRMLEVKVDRPNVSVAARRAYSLRTDGKPPAPLPLKKK
ncbi:MAG: VWA domain-containing protein [Acidobacteriota bacterium]|nr:VWA domain-containing protein [Acidobacteriota bacterium]